MSDDRLNPDRPHVDSSMRDRAESASIVAGLSDHATIALRDVPQPGDVQALIAVLARLIVYLASVEQADERKAA